MIKIFLKLYSCTVKQQNNQYETRSILDAQNIYKGQLLQIGNLYNLRYAMFSLLVVPLMAHHQHHINMTSFDTINIPKQTHSCWISQAQMCKNWITFAISLLIFEVFKNVFHIVKSKVYITCSIYLYTTMQTQIFIQLGGGRENQTEIVWTSHCQPYVPPLLTWSEYQAESTSN